MPVVTFSRDGAAYTNASDLQLPSTVITDLCPLCLLPCAKTGIVVPMSAIADETLPFEVILTCPNNHETPVMIEVDGLNLSGA